jgi:hypothetical protein
MNEPNHIVRDVFGHFQNLNLLALLHDLRGGRATRGSWSTGMDLCPVAHGLPIGRLVSELRYLGQTTALERGCDYAARHLGADPRSVHRFVELWDAQAFSSGWLEQQLKELWHERLMDADAVQLVLQGARFVGPSADTLADDLSDRSADVDLEAFAAGDLELAGIQPQLMQDGGV